MNKPDATVTSNSEAQKLWDALGMNADDACGACSGEIKPVSVTDGGKTLVTQCVDCGLLETWGEGFE